MGPAGSPNWRQRRGEEPLAALVQERLAVAHQTGALAMRDLERVVVIATVQPKAIAHPGDHAPRRSVVLHAKALHGNPFDGHAWVPTPEFATLNVDADGQLLLLKDGNSLVLGPRPGTLRNSDKPMPAFAPGRTPSGQRASDASRS